MIDNSWVEWLEDWRLQPSPGIWHATRSEGLSVCVFRVCFVFVVSVCLFLCVLSQELTYWHEYRVKPIYGT